MAICYTFVTTYPLYTGYINYTIMEDTIIHSHEQCSKSRRAMQDTLEVISGKWKLPILITLLHKPRRFKELAREIGISPRMLSKELQDLEANRLVLRTVYETKPVTVEYSITEYGTSLQGVMEEMSKWGHAHRVMMFG